MLRPWQGYRLFRVFLRRLRAWAQVAFQFKNYGNVLEGKVE